MRPSRAWRRRRLARRWEGARRCTPLPPAASWATPTCILRRQPPHALPKIRHCWERSSSLSDAASPRPIHNDKPKQTPAGSASSPQPFHLRAHTLADLQVHLCTCLRCHQQQDLGERGGDKEGDGVGRREGESICLGLPWLGMLLLRRCLHLGRVERLPRSSQVVAILSTASEAKSMPTPGTACPCSE